MRGTESAQVALDIDTLADALDYFNNVDDDEILRLREQSNAILCRVEGSSSVNVASGEGNLGIAYQNRAFRAEAANNLDRCIADLELALPHFRDAARIFRAINHVDKAETALRSIAVVEKKIRQITITRAAATAATRG